MSQSLMVSLKQLHPNAQIDVLAPAWSKPILERMPEVDEAIEMPIGHGRFAFNERRRFGKALRQKKYTWSIVLPNSWKSALIPWFANIPRRTAWKGEMRYGLINDIRHLDKQALPLMVQRFVHLALDANADQQTAIDLSAIPKPFLSTDPEKRQPLLSKFGLSSDKPILILCPGAEFGSAKQWPADYYQAVAKEKSEEGWQVLVLGSEADKAVGDKICADPNRFVSNLCGKTTLGEAVDLMSFTSVVVSNDSGLMHIPSAVNKPLVALYGATSPDFTPPLTDNAEVLSVKVECG
ncbi:MAG: lipopolysaccharide heptosyltransferase II, partial [Leucothrix sp.]